MPPLYPVVIVSLLSALPVSLQASTAPAADPDEPFAQCVSRLQARALDEGVSSTTVDGVLATVSHNPKIIEYDRRQPEFTETFANYLNRRVNSQRVEEGRRLLKQHADLLAEVTAKTGVPAPYLVAFWGMETNFGRYFGKLPILDSLATLACDPRRSEFFSRELIAALKIVDEGAIAPERMLGSWAGAMGHMQFLPSVFLRYAVDQDNDGKRDLWGSLPDAMASAGFFLNGLGWDAGTRWGREVVLPPKFPYELAGIHRRLPLREWRTIGLLDADQQPLPDADIEASLLVPAGHQGPAFLVYHNFHVIMGWNRSEFYAISVGHLADRIAGHGRLRQPPPADAPRLSRATVEALQTRLNEQGFDSGKPDGILGPATRRAIRGFQKQQGVIADGYPNPGLLQALRIPSSP